MPFPPKCSASSQLPSSAGILVPGPERSQRANYWKAFPTFFKPNWQIDRTGQGCRRCLADGLTRNFGSVCGAVQLSPCFRTLHVVANVTPKM